MVLCFSFVLVLLLTSLVMPVSAQPVDPEEVPYDTYTYWENTEDAYKKLVYNRPYYDPVGVVDNGTLGVGQFANLTDIFSGPDNITYLLDGGSSTLFVLDEDYKVLKTFTSFKNAAGEDVTFANAQGVFTRGDGKVYICDTKGQRVLIVDTEGNLQGEIAAPAADAVPEDFIFSPSKLAVDEYGYAYVMSENSTYGALVFSPEHEFMCFYGSNKVTTTIGGVIANFFKRVLTNNEKLAAGARAIPYQFSDLVIDSQNYIYTCTGQTNAVNNDAGRVARLSPNGTDILGGASYNFGDSGYSWDSFHKRIHDFKSIAVNEQGFFVILDGTYGRLYLYDQDCNPLSMFGGGVGAGNQLGTFATPQAIALNGDDLLVLDSGKKNVTVFRLTPYGRLVMDSQYKTYNGDYLGAKEGWEEVLSLDNTNQQAYLGLSKAALAEKDYKTAMAFAEKGRSYDTYDQAWQIYRRELILNNFAWIFPLIVVVLGGLVAFLVITQKKKPVLIKNEPTRLMFSTMLHPFDSFRQIKEKKKGSLVLCGILLVLFFVLQVMRTTGSGFLFSGFDAATFSSLMVLVRSVGLVLIWVVVNWAVSTLFEGKGRMKDILVVTCYSLIPLLIETVLFIALSHFLTNSESAILQLLWYAACLYTFALLTVGTMVIHDFSLKKFIGTGVLTLLGIALLVFIFFMLGILLQQLGTFLTTLFTEVIYR